MGRHARARRAFRTGAAVVLTIVAAGFVGCGASTRATSSPPAPHASEPAAPGYDLARDEARGGHTLGRHVGRTDQELRDRLQREERIRAASTYTDRATAERVVAVTLDSERPKVDQWRARSGPRPNLVLDYHGDPRHPIGRSLRRGEQAVEPAWDATVVLKWDEAGGAFVLTSYPEVRR
jgi:toxin YxiD